jgi:outer membrane protein assembly factor BamB
MKSSELVFIGIKGSVIAMNRTTGEQVWVTRLKGSDFVNVVHHDGLIFATCYGEVFCLDPLSGAVLWHNPLKGYGLGLATIALENLAGGGNLLAQKEKRSRDEAAASAACTTPAG